jgi:AraC family transcriptional regulator, positive regulator of tynA and feaB
MRRAIMEPGSDFNTRPMGYDEWRAVLAACGRYSAEFVEPRSFSGSVGPLSLYGCPAIKISCNADRVERCRRDVRLDGMEDYYAVFQLDGRSTLVQNDRAANLSVGDVALVDASRPVTYFLENRPSVWLGLHLPRQSLLAYLGVEPEGGLYNRGDTLAGRLLFSIVRNAVNAADAVARAEPYMQLALYDLLGALFGLSDLPAPSARTDRLFERISRIIRDRFADPDFGPREAAAAAGISLRYLQKLFTARGSSCAHFIKSVRLDHAAGRLHRRAVLNASQPIKEIAYASGFKDYTHFAKGFRRRFGHSPGGSRRGV